MIRYIKGIFHNGDPGSILVETSSGLGLQIAIPDNSQLYQLQEGDPVKVHTSFQVREDSMRLYGFDDRDGLELFEQLITVSGVGAKAAMAIMSALAPEALRAAILTGDAKSITKANGVGKKIAERVVLELKDKVGSLTGDALTITGLDEMPAGDERSEAVAALTALGYTKNEALAAVGKVREEGLTAEDYIKQALRHV